MNLNEQVCTLAQGKRLQELGIEQRKGIFEWCVFMPDPLGEKWFYAPVYFQEEIEQQLHEWIASAFTVAELGIMLAHRTGMCSFHHDKWKAEYEHATVIPECKNKGTGTTRYLVHQKTEAQARAAFLIYSIENGFITAEYCNKRLVES